MLFESPLYAENKYTFTQFAYETLDFVEQPVKWECEDYLKIGVISIATGLTMFADQPIRDGVLRDGRFDANGLPIQESQKYFFSPPIVAGRMYGELYSPIVLFSGFALYSLIADDIWSRKVAYEIGQASLYGGGLTFFLKTAIGRARPYNNVGPGTYRPFRDFFVQDYHSLPGGHCQAATIISTVLSRNVEPVWLKALFYVPAALTFVSRVYQDKHWSSDEIAGAAMGYYIATWVVDKHEKGEKSETSEVQPSVIERIQFQPFIIGDIYGINLSLRLF